KIVPGACKQSNACTIPPRQNADAVVFEFMNPTGTGRRGLRWRRQTRFDNPQAGTGTLTQRHGRLIGISTEGVDPPTAPERGFGGWGCPGPATGFASPVAKPIEPTGVPNIPALTSRQGFRNSSGSLAMFAAIQDLTMGSSASSPTVMP